MRALLEAALAQYNAALDRLRRAAQQSEEAEVRGWEAVGAPRPDPLPLAHTSETRKWQGRVFIKAR